jgi:hypothetical protein
MKKTIVLILFLCAALFSCEKDDNQYTSTVEYSFDSDANSTLMFKDGDPIEKMTSESLRY